MLSDKTINLIFLILNAIALILVTVSFERQTLSEDDYQGAFTLYAKYFRVMREMVQRDTATRKQFYQQILAFYVVPPLVLIFPTGFKLLFGQGTAKTLVTSLLYILVILGGYWFFANLATQMIKQNGLWVPKGGLDRANRTLSRRLLSHYAEQVRTLQAQLTGASENPAGAEQLAELRQTRTAIITRVQVLKSADQRNDSELLSQLNFSDNELGYLDSVSQDGDAVSSGLIIYALRYDIAGAFVLMARHYEALSPAKKHQDYQQYYHTQQISYWLVMVIVGFQIVTQLFG